MTGDGVTAHDTFRLGVMGAGAWGTALALMGAANGHHVVLQARDGEAMAQSRVSPRLPGHTIPDSIDVTADLARLADADAVLVVVPAQAVRGAVRALGGETSGALPPLVSCAKGIEVGTGKLVTDILAEEAGDAPLAALSGPSFAADVARGAPTAVALAATDPALARRLADRLAGPRFRVYPTDDLVGAELGGAVKNVLAIACGIAAGLEFGESAEAALIARGFAEMTRLGAALGARGETLSGLAGLGDLVLTAKSDLSRNRRFGRRLGQGEAPEAARAAVGTVEGAATAPALVALARRHGIEMPIAESVHAVVREGADVTRTIDTLMRRPVGGENLTLS